MSGSPFLYEPTNQSLPPSPELKARRQQHVIESEFSLDNIDPAPLPPAPPAPSAPPAIPAIPPSDKHQNASRRLRTVARYQAFHPKALACSNTLTSSLDSTSNLQEDSFTPGESSTSQPPPTSTSLGAIAGSQGVALFRLSRPHVPLLILSHATTSLRANKTTTNISGLAFHSSTTTASQLYLAAARGSATLVWDASGHSHMPLIGRLGSDMLDAGDNGQITSICWKPTSRKGSAPLLATTTANSISLWDLRVPPQGGGMASSSKPTVRFAVSKRSSFSTTSTTSLASPMLLQVACGAPETDELACIDTAGVVRIYDIRINERNRTTLASSSTGGSALSMFQAHETAGVGLCAFQTTNAGGDSSSSSSWLTWGVDSSSAPAVVKCWSYRNNSDEDASSTTAADPDDYWYMTAAPYNQSNSYYHLKAQLTKPNLAAARVCPSPFENSFLAVGHLDTESTASGDKKLQHGWWAEMCQLTPSSLLEDQGASPMSASAAASGGSFGLETTLRFEGGASSSHSSGDQEALFSALGGHADLGRLQAAELAFGSIPRQGRYLSASAEGDPKSDDDRGGNCVELVLCCLSDTSVITTHSVAEVKINGGEAGQRVASPSRQRVVKTSFPASHQPKVYQEDRNEGTSLVDAAGYWNSAATVAVDAHKTLTDELGRLSIQSAQSPDAKILSADPDDDDPVASQRRIGDMEVPVAYGSVSANKDMAMTDIASGTVVSTGGLSVVDESENAAVDVREATPILENIESGRVPCPPLCGASFGFGHGGLVMFHNGEIKTMWNWYQRTDTMRLHGMTNGKGDIGTSGNELLSPRGGVDSDTKRAGVYGPRTLKELVKMTETAKEAQWGARDGSDDSDSDNDDMTADENFFEDESSDSESSDDEEAVAVPSSNHMYNRYFGARAWKGTDKGEENPTTHRRTSSDASVSTSTKNAPEIVGPSYEMLAPAVRVTHDFDKEIICNQSVELAQRWELGTWEDLSSLEAVTAESKMAEYYDVGPYNGAVPPPILGQSLPGYKYLEPSWGNNPTLPRAKSDPVLDFGMLSPNSDGDDAIRYFRNMSIYPADSPGQWDGGLFSQGNLPRNPRREEKRLLDLGVYKLKELPTSETAEAIGVLERIKSNCQKNANACKSLNETEKGGVWRLLEETVDGQIKNPSRSMDGGSGRALAADLVSNLFSYYEGLGDVQMLATMFCVLSGGVRNTMQAGNPKLLPQGHDEKYDAYIKKYGELLYAWDLLSIRAEVRKHLRLIPQQRKQELAAESPSRMTRLPYGSDTDLSVEENADSGTSPGVAIVIHCPGCTEEINLNKQGNYCQICQDFPFRCSLCDNAVRGQFTFCSYCKHGGHLDHMTEWFASHEECPTGCGCKCKLANATTTIHIE